MFAPQATMRRAWTMASGSKPVYSPTRRLVARVPARGADRPLEEARTEGQEEAPVHAAEDRRPMLPAYE